MKTFLLCIVIALNALIFASCAPKSGKLAAHTQGKKYSDITSKATQGFNPRSVGTIAVLPLSATDKSINAFDKTRLSYFTQSLVNAFNRNTNLEIKNTIAPEQVLRAANKYSQQTISQQELAQKVGRELGAQSVLVGEISYPSLQDEKTQSREISVGFRLWLYDAVTGQMQWTSSYGKTQKPLTSNLLDLSEKLSSGVAYRSAEELLAQGFVAAAEDFENLRTSR